MGRWKELRRFVKRRMRESDEESNLPNDREGQVEADARSDMCDEVLAKMKELAWLKKGNRY
jgi:hypothetical protein